MIGESVYILMLPQDAAIRRIIAIAHVCVWQAMEQVWGTAVHTES